MKQEIIDRMEEHWSRHGVASSLACLTQICREGGADNPRGEALAFLQFKKRQAKRNRIHNSWDDFVSFSQSLAEEFAKEFSFETTMNHGYLIK